LLAPFLLFLFCPPPVGWIISLVWYLGPVRVFCSPPPHTRRESPSFLSLIFSRSGGLPPPTCVFASALVVTPWITHVTPLPSIPMRFFFFFKSVGDLPYPRVALSPTSRRFFVSGGCGVCGVFSFECGRIFFHLCLRPNNSLLPFCLFSSPLALLVREFSVTSPKHHLKNECLFPQEFPCKSPLTSGGACLGCVNPNFVFCFCSLHAGPMFLTCKLACLPTTKSFFSRHDAAQCSLLSFFIRYCSFDVCFLLSFLVPP